MATSTEDMLNDILDIIKRGKNSLNYVDYDAFCTEDESHSAIAEIHGLCDIESAFDDIEVLAKKLKKRCKE
jgi:hypothetical protein